MTWWDEYLQLATTAVLENVVKWQRLPDIRIDNYDQLPDAGGIIITDDLLGVNFEPRNRVMDLDLPECTPGGFRYGSLGRSEHSVYGYHNRRAAIVGLYDDIYRLAGFIRAKFAGLPSEGSQ